MRIDDDDSVFPLKRGFGRTNGDTARVITVIAENGQKGLPHVGIESLFDLFDPCLPCAKRNPILHLAGHLTGVATDAAPKVYYHAIFDLTH
jgi:hypothetical protein